VSLILEALRKLERDKDAPERGFVVLTHVPWAEGGGRSRLVGLGALALAVAVGALAVTLFWGRTPKPAALEPKGAIAPPSPVSTPPVPAPTRPASPPFEARALALDSVRRTAAEPGGSPTPSAAGARPSPSAAPELKLNAISQQNGQPVAILNDRLVREGDTFDGIHVIRIGETDVEVEIRGQRRVLTF
jgi:hypothetical protein